MSAFLLSAILFASSLCPNGGGALQAADIRIPVGIDAPNPHHGRASFGTFATSGLPLDMQAEETDDRGSFRRTGGEGRILFSTPLRKSCIQDGHALAARRFLIFEALRM